MSIFRRVLGWVVPNSVFLMLIYFGQTMQWAANVTVLGVMWLTFMAFVMLVISVADEKQAHRMGTIFATSPIPRWVDDLYDVSVILLFAWLGWWWCVVCYVAHAFMIRLAMEYTIHKVLHTSVMRDMA